MRRKRYYKNKSDYGPSPLEMLIELIAGLFFLLGKVLFKIIPIGLKKGKEIIFNNTATSTSTISRHDYFVVNFTTIVIAGLLLLIMLTLSPNQEQLLFIVFGILTTISLIAAVYIFIVSSARRLADIGMSSWFLIFLFIPYVNFIFLLFLILKKSKYELIFKESEASTSLNTSNEGSTYKQFAFEDKLVDDSYQENSEKKYDLKSSLLTPTEENFYELLKSVAGDRYQIIPQVQLSAIMKVRDSSYGYTNYHDFNKINKKSIDFVLYEDGLKPYLAIELDDYSHSRPSRKKRDEFVDKVMEEAGLRILHVRVTNHYDIDWLRSEILGN